MARPIPSAEKMQSWFKDFPEIEFRRGVVYCTKCEDSLVCNRKTHILEHLATKKHKTSGGKTQTNFNLDLIGVMVACNIPWKQLNNPSLRRFLQKCISGEYTDVTVPAETTLRKCYLSPTCDNIKAKIFSELNGKFIWISVDEIVDCLGRILVNVMVGGLDENFPMKAHLIACKAVDSKDQNTIANIVHTCLRELWNKEYVENVEKLLLFITNAAPYMQQVGRILGQTYPNMLHMTCLAHVLNELTEAIRSLYPDVNNLIDSIEIFLKAPDHADLFCKYLPAVELPPESASTRPYTWLEATTYYYTNFDDINGVVEQLDINEEAEVSNAKEVFNNPRVYEDLEFIHAHFSRIPLALKQLENSASTLMDSMNVLYDLRNYLFQISGNDIETVKEKFQVLLDNNPGFITMCCIVDLLTGKEVDFSLPSLNVATLKHFMYFKYAPVTSADIERSFSELKGILAAKRGNLTPEHLESTLIVHSYSNNETD